MKPGIVVFFLAGLILLPADSGAQSMRDEPTGRGRIEALKPSATRGIGPIGESQPIADNATKEGRQKNRRIEIHNLGCASSADPYHPSTR